MIAQPTVSVLVITYNQERYIKQAILSVLQQQTDFSFEVVVGEDCSSDKTRDVLLQLERQYPQRMKLMLHKENLGMMENVRCTYDACLGQYIAVLEGDDYWTDESKLQRQVDLMQQRSDASLCFHYADYVDQNGSLTGQRHPKDCSPELSLQEVIFENPIQTCSILLRRNAIPAIPAFFKDLKLGDWPLCILAARQGPICFIDRAMAAYRVHQGGVWTSDSLRNKSTAVAQMYLRLGAAYPDLLPYVERALAAQVGTLWDMSGALEKQVADYRDSWSYRLGRTILFPIRKLVGLFY